MRAKWNGRSDARQLGPVGSSNRPPRAPFAVLRRAPLLVPLFRPLGGPLFGPGAKLFTPTARDVPAPEKTLPVRPTSAAPAGALGVDLQGLAHESKMEYSDSSSHFLSLQRL